MSALDDIRARAEAATDGPWELAGGNEWLSPLEIDVGSEEESNRPTLRVHDAEFIAHARQDIPCLLAALDAVQALVKREKGRADEYLRTYPEEIDGPGTEAVLLADDVQAAIELALR